MASRRQLRRNLLRFRRYQLRYAYLDRGRRYGRSVVVAARTAHYRALVRLETHPGEAAANDPVFQDWACQRCDLPDPYHGNGDGIGSCDCSRCDCCGAAPDCCQCNRDWEDYFDDEDYAGTDGYVDYVCNDPACRYRQLRADRAEAAARGRVEATTSA